MDINDKLKRLAEEATLGMGIQVADAELKGKGRRMILRVTIDKEQGVTLEDCADVSRQLSAVLDVEDVIPGAYTLEVTSPGIDRPLKTNEDFKKNLGKLVKVVTKKKIDKQSFFIGRLACVNETSISIQEGSKTLEIPLDNVSRVNVEIEIK
jgi:ribosome maturation factor RimP